MITLYYSVLSIAASLLGLFSISLVWVAGSPRFGVLSQFAQLTGIEALIALSAALYSLSAALCFSISAEDSGHRKVSVLILGLSTLPFLAFLVVLTIRFVSNSG